MKPKVKNQKRELRELFGPAVYFMAETVQPETLDVTPELLDSVGVAAEAMSSMRGSRGRQQDCLAGLPFSVRLVLCMWLMDVKMASRLIRLAYSRVAA